MRYTTPRSVCGPIRRLYSKVACRTSHRPCRRLSAKMGEVQENKEDKELWITVSNVGTMLSISPLPHAKHLPFTLQVDCNVESEEAMEELWYHFDTCGKVVRIRLPNSERGDDPNTFFIRFAFPEGVENALSLTGEQLELGGRKLIVQPGLSEPAKHQGSGSKDSLGMKPLQQVLEEESKKNDEHWIAVDNVDSRVSDVLLMRHFSTCGTVGVVRTPRMKPGDDSATCYIMFTTSKGVEKALSLKPDELQLEGCVLTVRRGQPQPPKHRDNKDAPLIDPLMDEETYIRKALGLEPEEKFDLHQWDIAKRRKYFEAIQDYYCKLMPEIFVNETYDPITDDFLRSFDRVAKQSGRPLSKIRRNFLLLFLQSSSNASNINAAESRLDRRHTGGRE